MVNDFSLFIFLVSAFGHDEVTQIRFNLMNLEMKGINLQCLLIEISHIRIMNSRVRYANLWFIF